MARKLKPNPDLYLAHAEIYKTNRRHRQTQLYKAGVAIATESFQLSNVCNIIKDLKLKVRFIAKYGYPIGRNTPK